MDAFEAMGIKPDMGKSCIRFKTLEQLPLDTIARLIAKTSIDDYIHIYESAQASKHRN
jgi:hypothetical protein